MKTTDECLKAMKDRLAAIRAEAARLEPAIAALEGREPAPAKAEPAKPADAPAPWWPPPWWAQLHGLGCQCPTCKPAALGIYVGTPMPQPCTCGSSSPFGTCPIHGGVVYTQSQPINPSARFMETGAVFLTDPQSLYAVCTNGSVH